MLTSSFGGLWFKEWKMARLFHLLVGMGSLLVIIASFYFFEAWGVLLPIMIWALLHIFYLPGYVLTSLVLDSKQLHLWLHNPSSIFQLLIVKILQGLAFTTLSYMVFSGIAYLQLIRFDEFDAFMTDLFNLYGVVSIHLLLGSIALAFIIILLWSIHQYLKSHIGKWSFLVLILGIVLGSKIISWVQGTSVYQALSQWGGIEIPLEDIIPGFMELTNAQQIQMDITISGGNIFYIGPYIINTIVYLALFYVSCWILDRKVEV